MSAPPAAPPVYKPNAARVSTPPVCRSQAAAMPVQATARDFRNDARSPAAKHVVCGQPSTTAVRKPSVSRASGLTTVVQRAESAKEGHIVKYVEVDYGSRQANQGAKVHIVPEGWAENDVEGGKLALMYGGSSEQVRMARTYTGERPKQILRWLATVIFQKFGGVEIQCYWEASLGVILVSSNTDAINKAIRAAVESKTLIGYIEKASSGEHGRITRHRKKLLVRAVYDSQKSIKEALDNYKIVVPDAEYDFDLHAERRIRLKLGKALDPNCLGGVKRPCMACAYALQLAGARPGPLWTTKSALGGHSIETVLEHARANGVITYVTFDKLRKKLTINYDTESDSEGE